MPAKDKHSDETVGRNDALMFLEKEKADLEKEKQEVHAMKARLKRDIEAFEVAKGRNYTLSEIGEGPGIELVTEKDFVQTAELDSFMEEMVKVYVHSDGTSGALPVVCVNVNGINQPIIRGREQWVKRKYVEALARSRITNYEQQTPDPSKPDVMQMNDITSPTYPFAVREDRNPVGRRWLESILAQP